MKHMNLALAVALAMASPISMPTIMNGNFNFKTGNKKSGASAIKRASKKRKNKK